MLFRSQLPCAAFENITGDVARTRSGRTRQLFRSACKLGAYAGAGALTENEVTAALERAARENGLIAKDGLKVVTAHIKRGIARGMASPADLSKIELKRGQAGGQRVISNAKTSTYLPTANSVTLPTLPDADRRKLSPKVPGYSLRPA